MRERYPEIEPDEQGMLDVGDGNRIYWEVAGNPDGKPAVVVHGGPGSGCPPSLRRYFDPEVYRVVLFDQRQCGRSTPHASEPTTDLSTNTTDHLVADMELLREHLGIDRWLLFGGSWGSTLALAYAERHPQRVSEIVLAAVTSGRPAEVEWLTRGVGRYFPEEWERFRDGLPPADRDGDLPAGYARLLSDPDPAVREQAARDWCRWEDAMMAVEHGGEPDPRYQDPRFRMAFARIVTHYFANQAFLDDGVLLRDAGTLASIPGVLIHGRLDVGSPLITAWELHKAWPASELVIVGSGGHAAGMGPHILEALDGFSRRLPTMVGT